jgi:hypothetical protein
VTTALDALKKAAKYTEPVVHALQAIQSITHLGGDNAAAALAAIDKIISTTITGVSLGHDPKDIIAALDKLSASIKTNDAAADAALAAKFPKKDA